MFNQPRELLKAYREGFSGAWWDLEETDKLLGELPHPLFGVAASDLYSTGEGKLALLWPSLCKNLTLLWSARGKPREIVFHCHRNAVDVTRSHEIVGGQREDFITEVPQKLFTVLVVMGVRHVMLCSCTFCSSKWWHPSKKRLWLCRPLTYDSKVGTRWVGLVCLQMLKTKAKSTKLKQCH